MPLMLPVITDKLASELEDPTKFRCEKALPVMRPHKRYERDPETGKFTNKLKYEVAEADLQGVCDLTNKSIADSFHYPRETIGHISADPSNPEVKQPAKLVGVVKNFAVAQLPNGQKLIVADHYTRVRQAEALEDFPYRSAEYNWKTKKIRGVARILRDPALEMGTVCLSEDDSLEMADALSFVSLDDSEGGYPPKPAKKPGEEGKGDEEGKGKLEPGAAKDKLEQSQGRINPAMGDLNPDEVVAAQRLFAWAKENYPELGKSLQTEVGKIPDQIPDPADGGKGKELAEADAATKAGLDEEGNPAAKPGEEKPADENDPNGGEKKPPFNKTKKKPVEEDSMSQNAEVEALRLELRKTKIANTLDRLENVERLSFDRAEVEIDLLARDDAGQAKYIESLRKHSKALPASGEQIEVLQDEAILSYQRLNSDPISVSKDKMTVEQFEAQFEALQSDLAVDDDQDALAAKWTARVAGTKAKRK